MDVENHEERIYDLLEELGGDREQVRPAAAAARAVPPGPGGADHRAGPVSVRRATLGAPR